jgi:hypothetical protein
LLKILDGIANYITEKSVTSLNRPFGEEKRLNLDTVKAFFPSPSSRNTIA